LRYLSVCSGIEAASVACPSCGVATMPKRTGAPRTHGRNDWCATCYSAFAHKVRNSRVPSAAKRRWNVSSRYGLSMAAVQQMADEQGGVCAICHGALEPGHIDHCHQSGKVRGILCQRCNTGLGHVERPGFLPAALAYLERTKGVA
jgi:hypothetical protein